ncbi:MAG: GLPGLI family protein [Cyclobacteriaceae bacterium]|nr:GLPGLI family protein [Cyclobacteriaceae bacterium]
MIRLLFIIPLFLVAVGYPVDSAGQVSTKSAYTLRYDYLNFGVREQYPVVLWVQGAESLSMMGKGRPIDDPSDRGEDFNLKGEDSIGHQVYKNSQSKTLVFREFYSQGGVFEPCVVQDPSSRMTWKYLREEKRIGKYVCRSAQTSFRGRTYVAWYTEELPISHGPWKFNGLPGAVIEIQSSDHLILFRLNKVEGSQPTAIRSPSQGKLMTMKEFVALKEASTEDFINTLKAKLPRGAEITVNTTADYNLETDFSDVRK